MDKVAVVILNWNGQALLEMFLTGVVEHSNIIGATVYVADNASTDNSVDFIQANYPTVKLVILSENFGFAEGYNKALSQIESEYFVLLNSDVEVSKNWLIPIIELMDSDNTIAACQPKILDYKRKTYFEYAGGAGGFIDKYGYPFCRGRIFDTVEEDTGQYDEVAEVFWASGAAMFVRAELFKKLGGLDGSFFAHMEEIDLCWRMKSQGYKVYCVPQSVVYHVGGATLQQDSPRKVFLNFRNSLFMLYKNIERKYFLKAFIAKLVLDGVAGIRFLFSGGFAPFFAVIKAHFAFYSNIKHYKAKRHDIQSKQVKSNHHEVYYSSLVIAYFIKGLSKFSKFSKWK